MSDYDFLENRYAWVRLDQTRLIKNPTFSLLTFWRPYVIEQRLYRKVVWHQDKVEGSYAVTYHLWVGEIGGRLILEAAD